ncbi:hypothetical protein UFOVP1313_11 [uncultured Caudovirales phage]|uniref:Uncharacterized protein n=1 Tax=uncultured Caudovirales phage TaxID=2100421 RepID=A0A6J5RYY7_9CAUD|nr:hypothetical protein UFOVP1313_11 [uncultured Caudovirales phage]
MYIREDQADIRVWVDGIAYGDSWATAKGGSLDTDDSKTRPGGMGREVAVGGPTSRDDMTVETQLNDVVLGWHKALENKLGVSSCKVSITFLGPDRTPTGQTQTITGIVKSVSLPDLASDSNNVGMYTLVMACNETAT